MIDYYDKTGKPISFEEWAPLFEDKSYQIIRQTKLPDGGLVSTVWLGLNHNYGGGPPAIFETMAFWPVTKDDLFGVGAERRCLRYATIAEARRGHAATVKELWRTHRKLGTAMAEAVAKKKTT